jgi:hypothetical protein
MFFVLAPFGKVQEPCQAKFTEGKFFRREDDHGAPRTSPRRDSAVFKGLTRLRWPREPADSLFDTRRPERCRDMSALLDEVASTQKMNSTVASLPHPRSPAVPSDVHCPADIPQRLATATCRVFSASTSFAGGPAVRTDRLAFPFSPPGQCARNQSRAISNGGRTRWI